MLLLMFSKFTPLGTIRRSHVAENKADNWSVAISNLHSLHLPNSGGGNISPPPSYFFQFRVTRSFSLYLVEDAHSTPDMFISNSGSFKHCTSKNKTQFLNMFQYKKVANGIHITRTLLSAISIHNDGCSSNATRDDRWRD